MTPDASSSQPHLSAASDGPRLHPKTVYRGLAVTGLARINEVTANTPGRNSSTTSPTSGTSRSGST